MADVVVIGDGPGGLSAALFLAKRGMSVVVYGKDETAMHWAYLYNYLGIPEIAGSDFQQTARAQVAGHGARLTDAVVAGLRRDPDGFTVTTEGGEAERARFVVLSEGKKPRLAGLLGLVAPEGGRGIPVDRNGRTAVDGVYAVGRMVRPGRSQAIISAGDGAIAALDILAIEAGKDVADWDTPPSQE